MTPSASKSVGWVWDAREAWRLESHEPVMPLAYIWTTTDGKSLARDDGAMDRLEVDGHRELSMWLCIVFVISSLSSSSEVPVELPSWTTLTVRFAPPSTRVLLRCHLMTPISQF